MPNKVVNAITEHYQEPLSLAHVARVHRSVVFLTVSKLLTVLRPFWPFQLRQSLTIKPALPNYELVAMEFLAATRVPSFQRVAPVHPRAVL